MSWRQVADRLRLARWAIAWAVLGAVAGLCLLYSRWLFDGGSWWAGSGSAGRVRVFGEVVFDGQYPDRLAHRVVDLWFVGVAGVVAALGGLVAVVVGRTLPARFRRPEPGDRWLGIAATAAVASALAVIGVPGEDGGSWCEWVRRVLARSVGPGDVVRLGTEALRLLAIGLPIGWAVQAAAVAAGVRLARNSSPVQAADYDDAHFAEPSYVPIDLNKNSDS